MLSHKFLLDVVELFMCHFLTFFYTEGSDLQNYRKEIV